MFKYWSIKKYGNKLLPTLEKHFGEKEYYSAHEVRSTVYKKNFNPSFLPLGYIISLHPDELVQVMEKEFSAVSIAEYKHEIIQFLEKNNYSGSLKVYGCSL